MIVAPNHKTHYYCGHCCQWIPKKDKVIRKHRFCCPVCHRILRQQNRHRPRRVVENRL